MENYRRVNNKGTARKLYRNGITIHLIPCKVRLNNEWVKPVSISILDKDVGLDTFDHRVNNYTHYNCNAELGYYPHYYISEEDYNKHLMCELMCN